MLEKTGTTKNIIPAIANRWSPMAFSESEVSAEIITDILEAARWAPSSFNEQPWRFLVMNKHDNSDSYDQLLDCLAPFNKKWAATVPILILVAAKTTFDRNGKVNKHALFDTGQAVANMIIQATESGLHSHQIGGVDFEKAHEVFKIDSDYELVDVIALGYQGNHLDLPEDMRKREEAPRSRKPLQEVAFHNRFGFDN